MSTLLSTSGQQTLSNWGNYLMECSIEYQAYQRFKWLESEREGRDIGIERADWLWFTTGRDRWLRSDQS